MGETTRRDVAKASPGISARPHEKSPSTLQVSQRHRPPGMGKRKSLAKGALSAEKAPFPPDRKRRLPCGKGVHSFPRKRCPFCERGTFSLPSKRCLSRKKGTFCSPRKRPLIRGGTSFLLSGEGVLSGTRVPFSHIKLGSPQYNLMGPPTDADDAAVIHLVTPLGL